MDKLLPCLCGGSVAWCEDADHKCHRIVCDSCGLMADYSFTEEENDIESLEELRQVVAAKWNRRAPVTQLS